jgi:hypothetical protein
MQSEGHETSMEEDWLQFSPLLDEAMKRLRDKDRNAVLLRYFENKSLSEVGAALGIEQRAAQQRVARSLGKLRAFFAKRGVVLTTAIIGGAVSANSVQAAPVGLATKITATAAKGTAISATLTTLVKATMKTMSWLKVKFAVGLLSAALLAGGVATMAVSQISNRETITAQQIAKQAQDAYAKLSSYSDTGKVVAEGAGTSTETTFNIRLQRPNLYRVDWTQTGGFYTAKGIVWSDGSGDFFVMGSAAQEASAQPRKLRNMQMALSTASAVSGQASSEIPGTFFRQKSGDILNIAASGRSPLRKEKNETMGGVECYVISSVIDPAKLLNQEKLPSNAGRVGTITTTLWIGKQDHLIHQVRTIVEKTSIVLAPTSDSVAGTLLQNQGKEATPEAVAAMRTELDQSKKKAQSALKSGKLVLTQTHENIAINVKFSPSDFAR